MRFATALHGINLILQCAGILIFSLSIFDMYANLAKKAVFDVAVILIIGVVIIVYSILLVNAQKKYLAGYFKDSRNVKK